MPRSMTGFGAADGPLAGGRVHVEIRTVNHKHFNVQLRLGSRLLPFEDAIKGALRARIARGHVAVSARWIDEPPRPVGITVDEDRARAVVDALTRLRDTLSLPGEIDLGFVARQPDVLSFAAAEAPDIPQDDLLDIVAEALDGVLAMREREGEALVADLSGRLDALAAGLQEVRERAPTRLTTERDRLRASVGELLDGREVDENRLAQELALLADKLDINEEIVRLETHLTAARAAVSGSEPAGRALGFLGQEMLREINTIGSKANDAAVATAVIAMKGELERFREQLENVE